MTTIMPPDCLVCKWYRKYDPTKIACKAFPKKIPDKIYLEGVKHNTVWKDQIGEYVFEEVKKKK